MKSRWLRWRVRAFIALAPLLLSGCFVEASGGAYGLGRAEELRPAWSLGLAAGFYIDPGPVRVQLGGGGDFLMDDEEGEAESLHAAAGTTLRVDVTLARLGDEEDPESVQLRLSAAGAGPGLVLRRPDAESELEQGDASWAGMGYLGLTFGLFLDGFSLSASLGPATIFSESAELGLAVAVGSQLRLTVTWVPTDFGAFFLNGYDAEAAARHDERMQRRNQIQSDRLRQQYQQDRQQYRRNECIRGGGRGASCY